MKLNHLLKLIGLAAGLILSFNAWSIPILSVGDIDTHIASTNLSSSSKTAEQAWVQSEVGSNFIFSGKNETLDGWELVDGTSSIFAHKLINEDEYFLLKTGKGNLAGDTHFLFSNVSELSYAVIDLFALGFNNQKVEISKISHISEFGNATQVPEPAPLALLAIGLIALAFRKKK